MGLGCPCHIKATLGVAVILAHTTSLAVAAIDAQALKASILAHTAGHLNSNGVYTTQTRSAVSPVASAHKAASQDHEFHSKLQSTPRQATKSTASSSTSFASYFTTKPHTPTRLSATPQLHSPPPSKSKKKSHTSHRSSDSSSKKVVAKEPYHEDPHCTLGLVSAIKVGGKRRYLCCEKMCGALCGGDGCERAALDGSTTRDECCATPAVRSKRFCGSDGPPCLITHAGGGAAHPELTRSIERSRSITGSPIAFVVWSAHPHDVQAQYTQKPGKIRERPEWFKYDMDLDKVDEMIHLLFESARATHPRCRLVILTDQQSNFSVDLIGAGLGPPSVEIQPYGGMDTKEGMVSRMRARILFLKQEQTAKSKADLVFLDTDMLVLRPLSNVFLRRFDVAATWRQDPNQPVNGGIIFVRNASMGKGQQFFENMLAITMGSLDVMRRWFGTSDQVALSKLLTEGYGYNGPHPSKGKVSSKKILQFHFNDPETYETGGSIEVMLLPCSLFNGIGEKKTEMRQCDDLGCCCSEKSHVVHFKGKLKENMYTYWQEQCARPEVYGCAVEPTICKRRGWGRKRFYALR